jgi:hypothetical protein
MKASRSSFPRKDARVRASRVVGRLIAAIGQAEIEGSRREVGCALGPLRNRAGMPTVGKGYCRPRVWEAPPESLVQRGTLRTCDAQAARGHGIWCGRLVERTPRQNDSFIKDLPAHPFSSLISSASFRGRPSPRAKAVAQRWKPLANIVYARVAAEALA